MLSLKRIVTRSLAELSSLQIGERARPGFRVLLYHSVGGRLSRDPYGISIKRELFERHMELLARSDWLSTTDFSWVHKGESSLRVALTFDDGYKDNLQIAAPVLLKHRIPFTVFVTTDYLKSGRAEFLSPRELRELASLPGVTVGAHGATHTPLAGLSAPALWHELHDGRREIEDIIGREVTMLAYPHGSVNLAVRETAERAGYTRGGSSFFGINDERSDPLLLSRCEVWASDTPRVFLQKLAGAWDWYRWRRRPDESLRLRHG